jgi:hypothetical protein
LFLGDLIGLILFPFSFIIIIIIIITLWHMI